MTGRGSYVIVGVLVLAALVAAALAHGFAWTWVQLGWDDPYAFQLRELSMTNGIAALIGIVSAVVVLKNATTAQLATEVVDELSKVSWPSREETGAATVVVIVTVLACSLYLGVFDAMWLALTDWMLGIEAAPRG